MVSADLLLRLDERLKSFDDVHEKFRHEGIWSDGITGPETNADWIRFEAYMGFFERIYTFVTKGLLDLAYVNDFYEYRYGNIVENRTIVEQKLEGEEASSWTRFIELGKLLGRYPVKSAPSAEEGD